MREFQPAIGQWWLPHRPEHRVPGFLDWEERDGQLIWNLTLDGEMDEDEASGVTEGSTIHGETSSGPYTLQHAYQQGASQWREKKREPHEVVSERWIAFRLLHGDHVKESDRFTSAGFSIPHLLEWIGPSGLNYHASGVAPSPRITRDEPGPRIEAAVGDVTVTLSTKSHGRAGRAVDHWEAEGAYLVQASDGLTVDQVSQIAFRLTCLHAIVMNEPLSTQSLELWSDPDDELVREVDPRESHPNRSGSLNDPLFDTWEIDFPAFIETWLTLAAERYALIGFATPRATGMTVETSLIEACNGLEALATLTIQRPALSDADERLLDQLRDLDVGSKQRRGYKRYLQISKSSLQSRLVELARSLGLESAEWLLGTPLEHWAGAVAHLRNSLAHGSTLPEQLGEDLTFVGLAKDSVTIVLRLALLRYVGYTNMRGGRHGELLQFEGRPAAGHPNSNLFRESVEVARYAHRWTDWNQRALGATSTDA